MSKNTFIPIDKYAHAGYMLLLLPSIYWLGKFLALFGVEFIKDFCLEMPRLATLIFSVVIPVITLLLGGLSYIRHPHEKRKLAYQSLMALSIVLILLFLVSAIDGSIN